MMKNRHFLRQIFLFSVLAAIVGCNSIDEVKIDTVRRVIRNDFEVTSVTPVGFKRSGFTEYYLTGDRCDSMRVESRTEGDPLLSQFLYIYNYKMIYSNSGELLNVLLRSSVIINGSRSDATETNFLVFRNPAGLVQSIEFDVFVPFKYLYDDVGRLSTRSYSVPAQSGWTYVHLVYDYQVSNHYPNISANSFNPTLFIQANSVLRVDSTHTIKFEDESMRLWRASEIKSGNAYLTYEAPFDLNTSNFINFSVSSGQVPKSFTNLMNQYGFSSTLMKNSAGDVIEIKISTFHLSNPNQPTGSYVYRASEIIL